MKFSKSKILCKYKVLSSNLIYSEEESVLILVDILRKREVFKQISKPALEVFFL